MSVELRDKRGLEEGEAREVLVLAVCKGIEGSFHRHTRLDAEDHSESHCYKCQLHSNQKRVIPYENHFLFQFPIRIGFRTNLPVEMKQLFERFAFTRHHLPNPQVSKTLSQLDGKGVWYKADNMHEQPRKRITVEHYNENFLHRLDFCVLVALL